MTRAHTPIVTPGIIVRWFSEEHASQLVADWLAVFGKNRHGANMKAYLWHLFSGARYPNVSGVEAVAQYQKQTGAEFVVLSNDRKVAFAELQRIWTRSLSKHE